MQQLVGKSCTFCNRRIDSVVEGHFCPDCGNAFHDSCQKQFPPSLVNAARCSTCLGDLTSPLAAEFRKAREADRDTAREAKAAAQVAAVQRQETGEDRRRRAGLRWVRQGIWWVMIGVVILIVFPATWMLLGVGFLVLGGAAIGLGALSMKRHGEGRCE
jgi:hypothetical protein